MVWFGFMVFNATFNNVSAISWQSDLLVEETGVLGENHRPVASYRQTLSHNDEIMIQSKKHVKLYIYIKQIKTSSCKSKI